MIVASADGGTEELGGRAEALAPRRAPSTAEWFEALYREAADDLYAYVASLLRDRAAAEDVTAAAFERAFRRRRLFNPRRGSSRAWLFGIARNAALDELRRRRRTASWQDEAPYTAVQEAVDEELVTERVAVRAAMGRLPGPQRELILLKFHGQLSNAELAKLIGTSESNAGTRLHRAVAHLRKEIDASPS